MGTDFVKAGYLSIREDSLTSLFWLKRWVVLRDRTLTFHKHEVTLLMSYKEFI
jgi:hypothetical protein